MSMSSSKHQRRALAVQWLRRTHGWFGLWGAVLGLLFAFSGIWLNHRNVLQLPVEQVRSNTQVSLPDPLPRDARELASWLKTELRLQDDAQLVRTEPSRPVPWSKGQGIDVRQPERWSIQFNRPHALVFVEYYVGDRSASVRRTANGVLGSLMNLHKGVGMAVPWILLIDTLAGAMIFLGLSGVALWMLTHRRRVVGLTIFSVASTLTLAFAWMRIAG